MPPISLYESYLRISRGEHLRTQLRLGCDAITYSVDIFLGSLVYADLLNAQPWTRNVSITAGMIR